MSWNVTLYKIMALLSTEAKCVTTTEDVKEALWLKGFTKELWYSRN